MMTALDVLNERLARAREDQKNLTHQADEHERIAVNLRSHVAANRELLADLSRALDALTAAGFDMSMPEKKTA